MVSNITVIDLSELSTVHKLQILALVQLPGQLLKTRRMTHKVNYFYCTDLTK
jgi:hypothetical protein